MKKRSDKFERDLHELYEISKMLDSEGEQTGKNRYKVFVATILLFIDSSLHRIALVLFLLLGLKIGQLISGLF